MAPICRRNFLLSLCVCVLTVMIAGPAGALDDVSLGGKPLKLMGYITQSAAYGIGNDEYDAKQDWQSFRYSALLEASYQAASDLKFFVSGMLNGDWAYDILSDNSEWREKEFGESRKRLAIDREMRDLLKEAHITWSPGNFSMRLGKQIVVWGETDGFRLMDQINPLDQRRGITDIEFESSIIPIWLAKFEYFFQPQSSWLQDLGLEFIFNPNADFVADREIVFGNNMVGIWAPNVEIPLGPGQNAYLGSFDTQLKKPDDWDSDYYEYGFRVKAVIQDSILTLNYLYGIDNVPVLLSAPTFPRIGINRFDSNLILHPAYTGKFARFRILGATFTRDFEKINISALGGVGPVLRVEAFYGFDNTFASDMNTYEEHNEFRYAVGVDWKIKINWLNPRAYFLVSPQFYHRKVLDYPDYALNQNASTTPVRENTYETSLMILTTYFHNKLEPSFFWLSNWTEKDKGEFFRFQLKYEYSHKWDFALGTILINGKRLNFGFEPIEDKDHIYFTASYRF
jgi:hypothetical protein